MTPDKTGDAGSQPKRTRSESKAEITKRISQEIQQTEDQVRIAKTERLRAARLAMQKKQPVSSPSKGRARKPVAAKRSKA